MNCGYARTAIRELSSSKRRQHVDKTQRAQQFTKTFDLPSFSLTEEMFTPHNNYLAQFDRHCEEILNCFSKKWHPASKRLEYMDTFSISRWKELPDSDKRKHSVSCCRGCYDSHASLQNAFPGKPVYIHEPTRILSLPTAATERDLARNVLSELNPAWENQIFPHFHRGNYQSFARM